MMLVHHIKDDIMVKVKIDNVILTKIFTALT